MNITNLSLKKVIWLSIVLLILEAIFFVIFGSKVMKVVNYCKEQIITNRNYSMMHDEKVDVSSLPILQDDTTAWYSKYTLISHGVGGHKWANIYKFVGSMGIELQPWQSCN